MQKVIPRGLNYADITPEAIDCNIKMVKMTPTATSHNAQQNDIIQFQLQGNGFLDPYSTYLKFTVDADINFPVPTGPVQGGMNAKIVDRSAHSFINRLILRSNGVELERIENYDVVAAMLNDVTYSREQTSIHFNEGFPVAQLAQGFGHEYQRSPAFTRCGLPTDGLGTASWNTNALTGAIQNSAGNFNNGDLQNDQVIPIPYFVASWPNDVLQADNSNTSFFTSKINTTWNYQSLAMAYHGGNQYYSPVGEPMFYKKVQPGVPWADRIYTPEDYTNITTLAPYGGQAYRIFKQQVNKCYTLGSNNLASVSDFGMQSSPEGALLNGQLVTGTNSCTKMTFTIPLYSGLLGVLMPDKKFIPLSILPLNLELTLNPNALYLVGPTGIISDGSFNRNYRITDIQLCGHMLTFEQDIHRSLETVIAQNGLMIHYNTFYQTPSIIIDGTSLPAYAQINMAFKSIKSVHFLFYYSSFLTNNRRRKLHFVSHNISKLQLRNGIELMPSEPLEGDAGNIACQNGNNNNNSQFYIEMLKSWNKMHDVDTDSCISSYSFSQDTLACGHTEAYFKFLDNYFDTSKPFSSFSAMSANTTNQGVLSTNQQQEPFQQFNLLMKAVVQDQLLVGRSQYGFSLEGEELGQDKSIISGRKGALPFDINFSGAPQMLIGKSPNDNTYSQMNTYLLLDMIVYVRPDLVVTVLGK